MLFQSISIIKENKRKQLVGNQKIIKHNTTKK